MLIVKILVLGFLVFFSWSMGQTPPAGLNAFGKLVSALFFIVAPLLYFLPTIEAWQRDQKNITAIALINTFLGWSLIGWLIAMVWAVKVSDSAPSGASSAAVVESASIPLVAAKSPPARETRICPFCAEEVLAAAKICKHCHSELPPLTVTPAEAPPQAAAPTKGRCPSCEQVIPVDSATCPHCKADFGEFSTWKIAPL